MKISILTSKTAEQMVKEVVTNDNRSNLDVDILALPIPVISILDTKAISKIILRRNEILDKIKKSDMIIIPGLVNGSTEVIENLINKTTYKGPRSLGNLPYALDFISNGGKLDKIKSAEEMMGEIQPKLSYKIAFKISNVDIPIRGPPTHIISEIISDIEVLKTDKLAKRYVEDGAKILMIGSNINKDISEIKQKIKIAKRYAPVIVEVSNKEQIEGYLSEDIEGISISAEESINFIDMFPKNFSIIIGSRSFDALNNAYNLLSKKGINVIIDPVVGIPIIDFVSSIERYIKARDMIQTPIMFSAADVTEEMESDTHGLHAMLSIISTELGASLYLVVEETYKSYRGTAEAKESLRIAETSYSLKSSPRGLYSKLLIVKQSDPPLEIGDKVNTEYIGYIPPDYNLSEYIQIFVDHDRKTIKVLYKKDGKIVAAIEGNHALSLAREIAKRTDISKDHIAYLGYELSKAEIALKLGKSYIQDEPIIMPIWKGEYDE
ncbi:MAG: dihydropteroate synthase-like protein [Caldisphaera sp.]|jgi:dihydropteroate synthase-like protein|nr:MAG: dihydropteroate synthase-like protein [Caldisphaera sp.]